MGGELPPVNLLRFAALARGCRALSALCWAPPVSLPQDPGVLVPYKDEDSQRFYWVDPVTKDTTWDVRQPMEVPLAKPAAIQLAAHVAV